MLYKWSKDYEKFGVASFPGKGILKQTPDQKTISELEAKLREAELERDILKKSRGHFFQERSMIFDFIKNHEKIFPIEKMCQVLEVSSSGYYRYKIRKISIRLLRVKVIKEKMTAIYFETKQRYGSPRMTLELQSLGYQISRITFAKYM